MEVEDLLIKKEEILINVHKEDGRIGPPNKSLSIPIHPILFSNKIKINTSLPNILFPKAVSEWYIDLYGVYLQTRSKKIKEILNRGHKIKRNNFGELELESMRWRDEIGFYENGFAFYLSISRNSGGTLCVNKNAIPIIPIRFNVVMSKEKLKQFSINPDEKYSRCKMYHGHNLDLGGIPGATFLRNWAILYLNEAMKQAFSQI